MQVKRRTTIHSIKRLCTETPDAEKEPDGHVMHDPYATPAGKKVIQHEQIWRKKSVQVKIFDDGAR